MSNEKKVWYGDAEYSMNRYQRDAVRTKGEDNDELILGLAGEIGELINKIKKNRFHGHNNREEQLEEIGDILWYLACFTYSLESSLAEVAKRNIRKLRKRYPKGFSKQASKNRKV